MVLLIEKIPKEQLNKVSATMKIESHTNFHCDKKNPGLAITKTYELSLKCCWASVKSEQLWNQLTLNVTAPEIRSQVESERVWFLAFKKPRRICVYVGLVVLDANLLPRRSKINESAWHTQQRRLCEANGLIKWLFRQPTAAVAAAELIKIVSMRMKSMWSV